MLKIIVSSSCVNEKKYILDYIFGDIFNLDYCVEFDECCHDIKLVYDDKVFSSNVDIFNALDENWLDLLSLPSTLYDNDVYFDSQCYKLAVFDCNRIELICSNDKVYLPFDIFGTAFFIMSGYEESTVPDRDMHDRFTSSCSHYHTQDFIYRPLVNEYIDFLYNVVKKFLGISSSTYERRSFKVIPSHDVDAPFHPKLQTPLSALKHVAKGVLREHSIKSSYYRLKNVLLSSFSLKYDPFYEFESIFDFSANNNVVSDFYFISGRTSSKATDGYYSIKQKKIINLIDDIVEHDFNVGLHPSYNTYKSEGSLIKEVRNLENIVNRISSKKFKIKSRQHILRWDNNITPRLLDSVGISQDSTLGYADTPGFRRGLCYLFPLYDLVNRKRLDIVESPLILMECSLIDERYLGLGCSDEAYSLVSLLKEQCIEYKGDFVVLWHNHRFVDSEEVNLYKFAIDSGL